MKKKIVNAVKEGKKIKASFLKFIKNCDEVGIPKGYVTYYKILLKEVKRLIKLDDKEIYNQSYDLLVIIIAMNNQEFDLAAKKLQVKK